jgi:Lysine methyltransferase
VSIRFIDGRRASQFVYLKAACATAHGIQIARLVITDFEDHLGLIQKTVDANPEAFSSVKETIVVEHVWGSAGPLSLSSTENFDLIIASDVAYGNHIYEPLLQSLSRFSGPETLLLIGFTMIDTKPEFFVRLSDLGFSYRRLSDQLLGTDYRGTTFGVFLMKRTTGNATSCSKN